MSLTFRAVLPNTSEIFLLVEMDDINGLQHLLSGGGARPNDLAEAFGRNALSVSCLFALSEFVEFYLLVRLQSRLISWKER